MECPDRDAVLLSSDIALLSRQRFCSFACDFHVLWCISWFFVLHTLSLWIFLCFFFLFSSIPYLLIFFFLQKSSADHNDLNFSFLFLSSRKTSCCWIGTCLTHALSSSTSAWHTRSTLATILKTFSALRSSSVSLFSNWAKLQFLIPSNFPSTPFYRNPNRKSDITTQN